MRHIAITIIFGAALVGCSENRHKVADVKPDQKVSTQTLATTAPTAPVKTSARKPILRQTKPIVTTQAAIRNAKVTSVPAQKKALRAMTFNESQFSDDASDYPSTLEAQKLEREKYLN